MFWINLVSLLILTGTVFGIRCLIIPSTESMPRAEAVRFMGKLMPRARRILFVGLIFLAGSTIGHIVSGGSSIPPGPMVLTAIVVLVLIPLTLSPHRQFALTVEKHRKTLLSVALLFLLAGVIVTIINLQSH